MKKIQLTVLILSIVCCVSSQIAIAQDTDKNYIKTYTARVPIKDSLTNVNVKESVQQAVQYMDGLGRPKQTIVRWGASATENMVTHQVYDGYGRQTKQYLPFRNDGISLSYIDTALSVQNTFYDQHFGGSSGDFAFAETQFENAAMMRPKRQAAPGSTWQMSGSHTVDMTYRRNETTDQVRIIKVVDDVIAASGVYGNAALSVVGTTDENTGANQGETLEFTDKLGRVVLKKVKSDTSYLSTYYVYDEFNNLRYVVPPAAVDSINNGGDWQSLATTAFQARWMFSYHYDGRNRMIAKRVPGADWVHMIYDARDRLVLTQDGNQRADNVVEVNDTLVVSGYHGKNYQINGTGQFETTGYVEFGQHFEAGSTVSAAPKRWIFTKYDALDRPVMTGFFYDERLPEQIQSELDSLDQFVTTYTGTGALMGYDDVSFPTGVTETNLLTVTYYDDYGFTNISSIKPDSAFLQLRGQVTGAKTRVLGTSQWLETITFYDNRYRPIKIIADNHKNGKDIIETDYRNEVSALVEETRMSHTSDDYTGTLNVRETYTYDHLDRLLTQTHQINGGAVKTLVSNTYNDLGELVTKTLGGTVQQVDYAYNIRGWLKTINGGASYDANSGDQFGMELFYDEASQYNGNIGKMEWKSLGGSNVNEQIYTYTYDPLSRLKGATYQSSGQNGFFNVGNLNYDGNGNIMSLNRYQNVNGVSKLIDALNYQYEEGNQLSVVKDNGDSGSHTVMDNPDVAQFKDLGFRDGNTAGTDYFYDDNGNMIKDLNKGIDYISYNHLNLPERVTMDDGDYVKYVYDAAGIKLQKEAKSGNNVTTTDYIAGKHYVNNTLSFLQHAEGRTLYNAGAFGYEYNLTDHLGNVRVSVDEGGTVVQKDDYYPFGLTFNHYESAPPANQYTYNGKEEQKEWGVIDYGARMYDGALGRWNGIDAKSDKFSSYSPYNYALNNPILFIDPDGNEIVNPNSESAKYVKAQLTQTKTGTDIWERMNSSPNKITISVTRFSDEKAKGFKGQSGRLSRLTVDYNTEGGFVGSKSFIDGIEFDEYGISSVPDFTSEFDDASFNEETGEYEFNEGRELYMVVDLDIIENGSSSEIEVIAEEAEHSTQLYFDLGKFFKKKDPKTGKYIRLSKDEIENIRDTITGRKSDENYKSQRNEKEAKEKAKKVKDESEQ